MMNPEQIANMLNEDIDYNNGLLLEYKMTAEVVPLLRAFPDKLNFGFDLNSNLALNKEFTDWYKSHILIPFQEAYGINPKDHEPSSDFFDIIRNKDWGLFKNTDDKLVSIIRKSLEHVDTSKVETPVSTGRTTALLDKPHGYGRSQAMQRRQERRDERLDQPQ